jgi:hypothetical protein
MGLVALAGEHAPLAVLLPLPDEGAAVGAAQAAMTVITDNNAILETCFFILVFLLYLLEADLI